MIVLAKAREAAILGDGARVRIARCDRHHALEIRRHFALASLVLAEAAKVAIRGDHTRVIETSGDGNDVLQVRWFSRATEPVVLEPAFRGDNEGANERSSTRP